LAEYHPDRNVLERLVRGEACADAERLIDHIRLGCAICQPIVDELMPKPEALSPARSAGSSTALPTSQAVAPQTWPAALRHPQDEARTPPAEAMFATPALGAHPGCMTELSTLAMAEDDGAAEAAGEGLDRIFAQVVERCLPVITAQRTQAPRLLGELLGRPAAERGALVGGSRRFHTMALCKLLCERSMDAARRDGAEAVGLAELAIVVARHLDTGFYPAAVALDVLAGAWACLGNARRAAGDYAGAEHALALAESLLEDSADPLEEARLFEFKAFLLSDQGWFEEAVELLDSAADIYDTVKELHLKGKALISKGINLGYAGWPQKAVELISAGLAQLDAGGERQLELEARQDLAWFLNDCGRCDEARRQLDACRRDLQATGDPWTFLRTEWLDTRIALCSGRRLEAERRLRHLVQDLVGRDLGYEAALVTLDLAACYLDQGRSAEIRRLADDMLPLFLAQDIHRQAVAALVAFQEAAAAERLTPALVREISSYLLRARKNPWLSFQRAA
jgi:tetratricopeptide (TPR) repeat protein